MSVFENISEIVSIMSGPALENMDIMEGDDSLSEEIMNMSTADIQARTRLLDNEVSSRILLLS